MQSSTSQWCFDIISILQLIRIPRYKKMRPRSISGQVYFIGIVPKWTFQHTPAQWFNQTQSFFREVLLDNGPLAASLDMYLG